MQDFKKIIFNEDRTKAEKLKIVIRERYDLSLSQWFRTLVDKELKK